MVLRSNVGDHFQMQTPQSPPEFLGLNEVHAILVSALLAAFVAVWAIFSQRAITSRQTTLEFIRASEADRNNVEARQLFNKLAKDEDGLGKWARDEFSPSEEARAIRHVLNEQELIAIAIQRGILDDTTYRRFFRTGVIKTWQNAAPYILGRRKKTGNSAIYHELEELARWYGGAPNMPHRRFIWRKFL